ncbi:hydantoinase/oxoprolinase family protein [Microbacterium candidum]|uniref:Hydantoinase/oxoprolinase family protein n=1 Tax=Microbacterium candidum TaxID=3041922 RepID=A0ABT7MW75_9MICO|nr:hydantoinase/oxoprolinase family protein [Microbacterium sp. ASV49]MDL9978689.1 hydantoinase/oxoprolinase family protein [Microbacterium sp. ASV49]
MGLRIGIDVGGTNTDAAVLDGDTVVAATKATTTEDVTTGILNALIEVLSAIDVAQVDAVFIGTTHFINAIAQGKDLATVAAVRIATPPQSLLPTIDWPDRLLPVIGDNFHVVRGGSQFDGRLLNELDEKGLREVAGKIRAAGIRHVALSSVFSSVNADPEIRAAEILEEELPESTITRSALVGRVGLLERENATILNAALRDLADRVISGLERVVGGVGITAPILLSQNDGTVMTLERARLFPIFTIASGPTNSMRGAALLAGITDGVVIDVGGTTSDIGMLRHGFPRESTIAMSLAGVRSNFRIPDVLSLALGGGTIISDDGATVGPQSVGYRIGTEALVFGGGTTTFTDIGVAAGADPIGDPHLVTGLDPDTVRRGLDVVREMLVRAVEKAKLTSGDVPIIAVGGGAPLLKAIGGLEGMIIPENAGVANAVGASYAEAGGEVDSVYSLEGKTRAQVLEEAKELAVARAVEAGADAEHVRIIEAEEVPLTHLPGGTAVHARVKAVGPFIALKKGN